jgi:hypothetical protein
MIAKGFQTDSPLLKYGVLCIAVILWYSFVWDYMSTRLEDTNLAIENATARIGRLRRDVRRLGKVGPDLKKLKAELASLRKMQVKGETPQIVATTLQNMVIDKAKKAGLEVVTYKTVNRRKWKGYQLGVSTFTLKGDIRKFTFFFKMLQDEKKLFRISNLNISKVNGKKPYMRANLEIEAIFFPPDTAEDVNKSDKHRAATVTGVYFNG